MSVHTGASLPFRGAVHCVGVGRLGVCSRGYVLGRLLRADHRRSQGDVDSHVLRVVELLVCRYVSADDVLGGGVGLVLMCICDRVMFPGCVSVICLFVGRHGRFHRVCLLILCELLCASAVHAHDAQTCRAGMMAISAWIDVVTAHEVA